VFLPGNTCSEYGAPVQRSFDDLGTPLGDVTFCVVDLETTGSAAATCGITEIGAVKVRGGHCLGTFQTLVNPGAAIPPEITVLTGITQSMVLPAPRIEQVLPAFVEFAQGTVLVAHNARFDVGFLDAALIRAGWPRLEHPVVDTCALSRRLFGGDVPNHRLGTLASRLRLDHRPSHRALDDALATTDLLHAQLERAAAFGVLGLDDLLALPRIHAHPQAHKLRLTNHLPRCPGVYLFVDGRGEVLYVGKATNLRQRVRSYFSGDERRKIGALLREAQGIRHVACTSTLEAAVTEVRLIHRHQPRYNRQGKRWQSYAYVKLTLGEAYPRLAVVRSAKPDGSLYLGPLPSDGAARLVIDAVLSAAPLRRCTERLGRQGPPKRDAPCTPAQLGVATCPCAGGITPEQYRHTVDRVVRGLTVDPDVLLGPLRQRMVELAAVGRYEEAADVRDRGAALSGALRRQRRIDALRQAGELRLHLPGGATAQLRGGLLVGTGDGMQPTLDFDDDHAQVEPGLPLPLHLADEVGCVATWLDAESSRVRVEHCEGGLAWPVAMLASFEPAASRVSVGRR
jgi:DNA polymerase III subunit epsilon